MAKEKVKNKKPSKRWKKYKILNDKLIRDPSCPKCGEGIFLGKHADRLFCGRCHYVEFTKR